MSSAVYALPLLLVLTACQLAAPPPLTPVGLLPQRAPAASTPASTSVESHDAPAVGPGHQKGDSMMVVHLQGSIPILGKAIFWDGNGEVDNFGFGVSNYWFETDYFAWSATLNGTLFKATDGDIWAAELELGGRWYLFDVRGGGVYWDTTVGYQQSDGGIPPGGTHWNFTFSFGPGIDLPLTGDTSILAGATFHHMSNATGRDSSGNPSQNEGRFYIGLGWEW